MWELKVLISLCYVFRECIFPVLVMQYHKIDRVWKCRSLNASSVILSSRVYAKLKVPGTTHSEVVNSQRVRVPCRDETAVHCFLVFSSYPTKFTWWSKLQISVYCWSFFQKISLTLSIWFSDKNMLYVENILFLLRLKVI